MTRDICTSCGRARAKGERFFFVYPDIVGKAPLQPVACFCKACGAERGMVRRNARFS